MITIQLRDSENDEIGLYKSDVHSLEKMKELIRKALEKCDNDQDEADEILEQDNIFRFFIDDEMQII